MKGRNLQRNARCLDSLRLALVSGNQKSVCGSKKDQAVSDVGRKVSLDHGHVVKNLTVLELEM